MYRKKDLQKQNLVLKQTANTVITANVLVMLDPSVIIPLALFAYSHKFKDSKWMLIILPKIIVSRKIRRIYLGTELNYESFYLNLSTSNLKGIYDHSEDTQTYFRFGISYNPF